MPALDRLDAHTHLPTCPPSPPSPAPLCPAQVIGIYQRAGDLKVNPCKKKALTNMRASGKDATVVLSEPIPVTLDFALEVRLVGLVGRGWRLGVCEANGACGWAGLEFLCKRARCALSFCVLTWLCFLTLLHRRRCCSTLPTTSWWRSPPRRCACARAPRPSAAGGARAAEHWQPLSPEECCRAAQYPPTHIPHHYIDLPSGVAATHVGTGSALHVANARCPATLPPMP